MAGGKGTNKGSFLEFARLPHTPSPRPSGAGLITTPSQGFSLPAPRSLQQCFSDSVLPRLTGILLYYGFCVRSSGGGVAGGGGVTESLHFCQALGPH